ncbi:MAG: hypothetical protein R6U84_10405 [Candidatus Cloacimonadales bacterium]
MKIKLALIILLFSSLSWASTLQSNLQNADSLFIGTPFQLQVDIFSAAEDSIYVQPIDTLDIFVLAGKPQHRQKIQKDSLHTTFSFTFQPFDVGTFTLPGIDFFVNSADTMITHTTPAYDLQIYSTVADTVNTISDIAAPAKIYLGFWDYLIILAGITLIILIIYYLRKYLKKPAAPEPEAIIKDTRPAYIIALEALRALQKEDFLRRGDYLSYYFRLSFILRLFIELHYQIRALEMTTSEVRDNLTAIDPREKSQILDFMRKCDMIKFAKFTPELKQAEQALDWLENYLQSFQPQEENHA